LQRLRVLQVLPELGTGGAERVVVGLVRHLDPQQFETAVLSLYPASNEPFERELAELGARVYYLAKRRGFNWRLFGQVQRVFSEFRPDVVHNHLYLLYAVLPACLRHHVRVRVHTIHSLAQKEAESWRRPLHSLAFRHLGVVPVSICQYVRDSVRQTYGEIGSPVIINGIDTSKYQLSEHNRLRWREHSGLQPDNLVFVHVARFSAVKNHRLLINAFTLVARQHAGAVLLLVGEGPLREEMMALAARLGLQPRIRFLGLRTDVHEILNASDVFVLSSDWEGLPMSVLEAMAAAKPVVATAVGGVRELVADGENGLLVPPGDCEALAAAMSRICEGGAAAAAAMGSRGRKLAVERFDAREMARQYGELYLSIFEHRTTKLETPNPEPQGKGKT